MKAIIIKQYGASDQLIIQDIPIPAPQTDEVLIRIRAFGINRAEIYMRKGLWGDVAKVSGIECVGEIASDPAGKLSEGQTVAAIMGGMGRTINGSYAEYTCVPASNVFVIETSLSWVDLAPIPESYATAWHCLHENMAIQTGDSVFVRGGTSALGQAAINIASNIDDVRVIASSRSDKNTQLLKEIDCADIVVEQDNLSDLIRDMYPSGVGSVMDIIGNTTLLDSLKAVKTGGVVCNAGFLGGGDPISFNPLMDLPSSVNLNFFASFMFGTKDFPISNIPMQKIVEYAEQGAYQTQATEVFGFDDISAAHDLMESNLAHGKIVVEL